jgi:tRNA threonylcarbamoyladenosine biosynthesis protein TsaE
MHSGESLTRSPADTESLGERLGASLTAADVVYLVGDLGSGKTTLVRGIARGLGAREREVASPTFALLHKYTGGAGDVVLRHLDLYRLDDDPRDLAILGLPEAVSGAPLCVEWPRRAIRGILPATIEVTIEAESEESRRIRIVGG